MPGSSMGFIRPGLVTFMLVRVNLIRKLWQEHFNNLCVELVSGYWVSEPYIQDFHSPIGWLCLEENSDGSDQRQKSYLDFAVGNFEANSAVHVDIDHFRVLNWLFRVFGTAKQLIPNPLWLQETMWTAGQRERLYSGNSGFSLRTRISRFWSKSWLQELFDRFYTVTTPDIVPKDHPGIVWVGKNPTASEFTSKVSQTQRKQRNLMHEPDNVEQSMRRTVSDRWW